MSSRRSKGDHGTFTLNSPEENVLLVQLTEKASKNPERPGEAFGRITFQRTQNGRNEQGLKKFHLDLNKNQVTITEEWAGVETAKKTISLSMTEDQVDERPVAAPPPGPDTTTFYRLPFRSADMLPEEELRDWAKARAEDDVMGLSVLPRRIRLFGEGFQEIVLLPHPFAPDLAPGTGATVQALRGRRGVERRLVEGWFASGEGRGTAWILDVLDDDA